MRSIALIAFAALTAATACAQLTAVDIRPSAPNTILEMRSRFFRGHYELRNATLVDLIDTAWSVDPDKVVGGPDWLDTDRFDITATAPADASPEALKIMLRGLLADRFHLVVREECPSQASLCDDDCRKASTQTCRFRREVGMRNPPDQQSHRCLGMPQHDHGGIRESAARHS